MTKKPKKTDVLSALNLDEVAKKVAAEVDKMQPKKTRAEMQAELVAAVTQPIKTMRSKGFDWKDIATTISKQADGFMIPVQTLKEAAGEAAIKPASEKPKVSTPKSAPIAKS